MKTFVPAEPFPPGEYIKDEIEARGWTQDDLADVMGISRRQLINLIQGKSGITPDTAQALADAFGQNARTWMNLQVSYELGLAAQKERTVERRARIFNKVPVRELKRRGWIPDVADTETLEKAVCRFLRIENIDDDCNISIAARKSASYDIDTAGQVAWYCRARELAEHVTAARYSKGSLDPGIADLLALAGYPEDARGVPKVLADIGIRLVVVERLQRTKVDGAAFWLDPLSPVIALSVRYDRIDNFWFTLMHELVHVKHRDASPVDVDLLSTQADENLPEIERRANREAANYLIPEEKLESFILRAKPLYYQKRVVQFAQARGIHPGVVVGQLQNRKELTYQQLRKLLVKVRHEVVGSAMSDGWGNTPNL